MTALDTKMVGERAHRAHSHARGVCGGGVSVSAPSHMHAHAYACAGWISNGWKARAMSIDATARVLELVLVRWSCAHAEVIAS